MTASLGHPSVDTFAHKAKVANIDGFPTDSKGNPIVLNKDKPMSSGSPADLAGTAAQYGAGMLAKAIDPHMGRNQDTATMAT
jgi:hypothetical protein